MKGSQDFPGLGLVMGNLDLEVPFFQGSRQHFAKHFVVVDQQ
jgi:hypothetical protein